MRFLRVHGRWPTVATLLFTVFLAIADKHPLHLNSPLVGVVDFHVHSAPDTIDRTVTDRAVARRARRAGMRALVFKNHFTMTADRAALAMQQVAGIEIFGGVVLNRAVGGLNPEAVRTMLLVEGGRGRVVWLPTDDAEYEIHYYQEDRPFVPVMRDGRPLPELIEIFELIGDNDLALSMGHSSPEETLALIPVARRHGVERIVVGHLLGEISTARIAQVVGAGAIIELDWISILTGPSSVADAAALIREVGAEHFLISSDLGRTGLPPPTEGLQDFIGASREQGIQEHEIDAMGRRNPARLLGLEPWQPAPKYAPEHEGWSHDDPDASVGG